MSVQQEIKRLTAPDIRARIIAEAEALERRTKPAGGRNGVLGYVGPSRASRPAAALPSRL